MKKQSTLTILVTFIALSFAPLALTTCGGGDDDNDTGPDIYIAGSYHNGSTNIACYWKNGVKTDLDTVTSQAVAIAVEDGIVYVAGTYYDGSTKPCYWEGGIRRELLFSDPEGSPDVTGIAVENGTVYVTSRYFDGISAYKACYWQNAARKVITGANTARAIAVAGGTVYVAGSDTGSNACYWKITGATTTPTTLSANGYAHAITVVDSGGTVYTAGHVSDKACYWRDTAHFQISTERSLARAIAVVNGTVYTAGEGDMDEWGFGKACYWKGGIKTPLSSADSEAHAISVCGGDIYVAGWYYDGSTFIACYWKNGEKIDLHSGTSRALAMVVQ